MASVARTAEYATTSSSPQWDDMDAILTGLGFPFDTFPVATFQTYAAFSSYTAIFVNCGGDHDANATDAAVANVRQWVANGGTLYASDWAYKWIEKGWPDMIDFGGKVGDAQFDIPAAVTDASMRDFVGASTVDLDFNLGAWVTVNSIKPPKAVAYLVGAGGDANVNGKPILIHFPYGNGNVIYTSFHNEAGLGPQAQKVLEYMVLIAVLRPVADQLATILRGLGYIPVKENLSILPGGNTSSNFTVSTSQDLDFAFAAAWKPTATLRVNVTPPSGPLLQGQSAASPVIVISSNAAPGTWSYTSTVVTASTQPFVLMAAQKIPAYPELQVKTYPNPFKSTDHDVFVFDGLPTRATLRIYTITGQLVKTIEKNDDSGTVFWYVDNQDGEKIASGLYLFSVEAEGRRGKGKIAINR